VSTTFCSERRGDREPNSGEFDGLELSETPGLVANFMLFLAVLHQVLALLRREICLFRNIVAVLQLLLVGRKVGLGPSGLTSIQKVLPLLARKEAFGRTSLHR
jgi:hypothetical protein